MGKKDDLLREAELRFQSERDRRYTEVAVERDKALQIKNEADKVALQLAREIQTYKDEKANELREQINSERGIYATKSELKPVQDYITAQGGQKDGLTLGTRVVLGVVSLAATVITVVLLLK